MSLSEQHTLTVMVMMPHQVQFKLFSHRPHVYFLFGLANYSVPNPVGTVWDLSGCFLRRWPQEEACMWGGSGA